MQSSGSRSSVPAVLCDVPQLPNEEFLEGLPLPPFCAKREPAVKAIVEELGKAVKGGKAPLTKNKAGTYTWAAFPKEPQYHTEHESTVFAQLEGVANDISGAISACKWIEGAPVKKYFDYKNNGNRKPDSGHRRDSNTSRPDAYAIRSSRSKNKGDHWWDIGPVGEYKKVDSESNFHDDAQKVLWSMNVVMREDPCRRSAYGITIENRTTRLWFCDRTRIVCSQKFNFCEEPEHLVSFFLTAMYSDETSLGWDPTIKRVITKGPKGKPEYQYDITVHQVGDGGVPEEVVYRTEELLSQLAADGILGRGTRVWTARRVGADGKTFGDLVVIKDYWVDSDRRREGTIVTTLRDEAEGIKEETQRMMLKNHVPTVVGHGDVRIHGSPDETKAFRDIHVKKCVTIDLVSALIPLRESTDKGTGSHISIASFVKRPVKRIHVLDPKTHYRIVFKERGHALHEEKSLKVAFTVIRDVVCCLCAIHLLGWVHRDISTGNILVCGAPGKERGLLTDFEYAKRCDDVDPVHQLRTGTEYFMSIEADMHTYRYRPREVNPVSAVEVSIGLGRIRAGLKQPPRRETRKDEHRSLPFRYHPLNDYESLFWVSLYMVADRVVVGHVPGPNESAKAQYAVARLLFYDRAWRTQLIEVERPDTALNLLASLHKDVVPVADLLLELKEKIYATYLIVEKDPTTHPDPQKSVSLVVEPLFETFEAICAHLDKHDKLYIKPFPGYTNAPIAREDDGNEAMGGTGN
ncbi:hypothetical protein PsYK624_126150 [Phanerochaete sordida]|uniref:Fungal-type protein kinase domain-containing protein n=1 Tax=Phanerochaete sordida TaxID=48140 RepID=A0A9P3LIQ5_9APHY|nr:hypothetical protein PsYK624_126150 [Phanerochaete sordida]